jgi:hypothetical protein
VKLPRAGREPKARRSFTNFAKFSPLRDYQRFVFALRDAYPFETAAVRCHQSTVTARKK